MYGVPSNTKNHFSNRLSTTTSRFPSPNDRILYRQNKFFSRIQSYLILVTISLSFKEYIFKQYKYNYYIKYGKNKVTFEDAFAVEKWPITLDTDSPVWFNFAWYGSLLSMIIFMCVQCKRMISWNPWTTAEPSFSIKWEVYNEFGWECIVGWFLHFYIFTMSPHFNLGKKTVLPKFFL